MVILFKIIHYLVPRFTAKNFADITFDNTEVIQLVLEQAYHFFSQKQNFTDRDGEDFGHITVWENPDIKIQSNISTHPILKLVILEYLEEGHEVNNIIKILIWIESCICCQ